MEDLETMDMGQLMARQANAQRRVAELSESFMKLRAGGCAMEAQLDAAQEELKALEGELRRRFSSAKSPD